MRQQQAREEEEEEGGGKGKLDPMMQANVNAHNTQLVIAVVCGPDTMM